MTNSTGPEFGKYAKLKNDNDDDHEGPNNRHIFNLTPELLREGFGA